MESKKNLKSEKQFIPCTLQQKMRLENLEEIRLKRYKFVCENAYEVPKMLVQDMVLDFISSFKSTHIYQKACELGLENYVMEYMECAAETQAWHLVNKDYPKYDNNGKVIAFKAPYRAGVVSHLSHKVQIKQHIAEVIKEADALGKISVTMPESFKKWLVKFKKKTNNEN